MAKTKTTPKVDGASTSTTSASDAPAAVDKTKQNEPAPRTKEVEPIAVKLTRLGGAAHDAALRRFNETSKVSSGTVLRWNKGVPEFYKRG